ncbi:DinB family protein [Paenibacillus alba]|uniref:DinB family protein n=1 Tax=Paenibacillus alba TaxID=1197127 RepID=A0ABU6G2W0_9BACL|nr:DinB family protein [Paenibacillus alba]MEC0227188.1 DinB family protein [Paenibacillus alba]NQX67690.1 DinB family protein [Paenibacillus alba]
MNTTQTLQKLEEIIHLYEAELTEFSMEQLTRQPSETEWSLGQVYVHLIQTSLYMQIRNIETCLQPSEATVNAIAGKTQAGEAVFEAASFPPIKISVPASPQYTPSQPLDKEQIMNGLQAVLSKLKEIQPQLETAPVHQTAAHPRFGGLHAKEWFQLIEMHFRHHRLQIDRLKQELEISI